MPHWDWPCLRKNYRERLENNSRQLNKQFLKSLQIKLKDRVCLRHTACICVAFKKFVMVNLPSTKFANSVHSYETNNLWSNQLLSYLFWFSKRIFIQQIVRCENSHGWFCRIDASLKFSLRFTALGPCCFSFFSWPLHHYSQWSLFCSASHVREIFLVRFLIVWPINIVDQQNSNEVIFQT